MERSPADDVGLREAWPRGHAQLPCYFLLTSSRYSLLALLYLVETVLHNIPLASSFFASLTCAIEPDCRHGPSKGPGVPNKHGRRLCDHVSICKDWCVHLTRFPVGSDMFQINLSPLPSSRSWWRPSLPWVCRQRSAMETRTQSSYSRESRRTSTCTAKCIDQGELRCRHILHLAANHGIECETGSTAFELPPRPKRPARPSKRSPCTRLRGYASYTSSSPTLLLRAGLELHRKRANGKMWKPSLHCTIMRITKIGSRNGAIRGP